MTCSTGSILLPYQNSPVVGVAAVVVRPGTSQGCYQPQKQRRTQQPHFHCKNIKNLSFYYVYTLVYGIDRKRIAEPVLVRIGHCTLYCIGCNFFSSYMFSVRAYAILKMEQLRSLANSTAFSLGRNGSQTDGVLNPIPLPTASTPL